MNIGDIIVITEAVFVVDELGHDLLIAGTEGTLVEIAGDLLTVQTAKKTYDSIPVSCVKLKTEVQAA